MMSKPTIIYVKDGEEKIIVINKFNKKIVYKKILKYLNFEEISSLKFINYDFSDNNSYFDRFNFFNSDIELIFENCKFGVWHFKKGEYLKLVNILGNETGTRILIENIEKVDIELSDSLENSNIIVECVNNLNVKLKNANLNAISLNDVRNVYIEGMNPNTYFKAKEVRNLFLKDSNIDIIQNDMNFKVIDSLELNNSTINLINFNKFEFAFDLKIILINSNIKADKMLKISDISNILFRDLEDDTILDNSSYIETCGIIVGDKELFNCESRVIFDKNMLIDLVWNVMYVKNGVTYKEFLPNNDFFCLDYNFFVEDEGGIKLLDDIELLHFKKMEFNYSEEIVLNNDQVLILDDCSFWYKTSIKNGNVEIINNEEIALNLRLVGSKDVNIIVEDKYLDNADGRLDLIDIEKATFCIKNGTLNNKISFFKVVDCVLGNDYDDNLCLKRLDCEEVRVENVNLRVKRRNNIKYQKLSLINSGIDIDIENLYVLPDLNYLYMSNSYIHALGNVSLPNLNEIVVNDNDENVSYISSDELLLIGDKIYEKQDGLSSVRVNVLPNSVNSLGSGRRLLTMKLKSISDNLNSGVLAIDQEEKKLLDELDLLERELLFEIEEERRKIKDNMLVKKHKFLGISKK